MPTAATLVGGGLLLGVAALVPLHLLGLVQPFTVPGDAMLPALYPGDWVCQEGLTHLLTRPQHGDVVIFRTDEVAALLPHSLYIGRLVGLPSDPLRLTAGVLYVNGQPTRLRNQTGSIPQVAHPAAKYLVDDQQTDNSLNSLDSRFWGFLPAKSVLGRAVFCYAPREHAGWLR